MSEPQQRELACSERGEIDPQSRKVTREGQRDPKVAGRSGSTPGENRPGHRPERNPDKPAGAP